MVGWLDQKSRELLERVTTLEAELNKQLSDLKEKEDAALCLQKQLSSLKKHKTDMEIRLREASSLQCNLADRLGDLEQDLQVIMSTTRTISWKKSCSYYYKLVNGKENVQNYLVV